MTYLILAAGLLMLVLGGEALVRGAVALASRLGVSPLLIGLTLLGFGTSTPELAASVAAALAGSPGIAVGNVVGSNIANILLIVGLAAILYPLRLRRAAILRDGGVMLAAALACVTVALFGTIGRPIGAALVVGLVAYVAAAYWQERGHVADTPAPPQRLPIALALLAAGLALVIAGAGLLVDGAIALARGFGVSETVIGLTIVAVGTSLPELVTSVVASVRRQGDVALGNILGSNIYNVLAILGVTALVQPIDVPARIAVADVWIMLAVSAGLLAALLFAGRVGRGLGLAMVIAYALYVASMAAG